MELFCIFITHTLISFLSNTDLWFSVSLFLAKQAEKAIYVTVAYSTSLSDAEDASFNKVSGNIFITFIVLLVFFRNKRLQTTSIFVQL